MCGGLLAVFQSKRACGVRAPTATETFDWRAAPASPRNRARVRALGTVLSWEHAFARSWLTDAHFVSYVLFGPEGAPLDRQPRVNKSGLAWVRAQGYAVRACSLWADLDNPGHAAWSRASKARALAEAGDAPALRDGPWYFTPHGRRVGRLLDHWVDVEEHESLLVEWHRALEGQGLAPDRACRDWTRMFRLPTVVREAAPRERPRVSGARARSVRANAGYCEVPAAPRRCDDEAPALAPSWRAPIDSVARAVRSVETEWHTLFLALAGALCELGVEPAHVPSICLEVSRATGADTRPRDRVAAAETTVRRFAKGEPIAGIEQLVARWPTVHGALEAAFGVPDESPPFAPPRALAGAAREAPRRCA